MRILVYGLSANKLAGIETFLLNMNKFMSKDMIFDYVLESDEHSTIHQQAIDEKGGKNFYIPPKRQMLKNAIAWNKLLKDNRSDYDTVYFNMYSLAWFLPIIFAKMKGYTVVVHAHNNNLHNCGFLQKFMHAFNRWLQKFMNIKRFTNSELSAKFFFGNSPATMIYCAIDPERFKFDPTARKKIRGELGISEDKHVYGFSGRVEFQKNPLFLMDIFQEVQKLNDKAEFLVCGDGDLMEETKKKADEYQLRIHFTGSVKSVEQYYQAMDAFVLPSRFEGLGIVLVEAQCAGLPCVTSDEVVPAAVEVVEGAVKRASLEAATKAWAEEIVKAAELGINGNAWQIVNESRFNIKSEAKRLERALADG